MTGKASQSAPQVATPDGGSRQDRSAGPDATEAHPPGHEPLVACISHLARQYGNPQPPMALVVGLPLGGMEGFSWESAARAADRAGLILERVKRPLKKFKDEEFPVILPLKDGRAIVLNGTFKVGKGRRATWWARFVEPSVGTQESELTLADLEESYTGQAILVRPDTTAADVIGGVSSRSPNSWFWSAFAPSAWIYRQVILGTIIINLLALALPLFIMNVYDRVVPNNAVETLWALAMGVMVAALFDFILRSVRGYFIDVASRRADVTLANRIFDHVLGAKFMSRGAPSGARANILREYETLRDFFNSMTLATFGDMPFILLFIGIIWAVAGDLALVPAITVPVVIVVVLLTQIPLNRLVAASFAAAADKNSVLFETLGGLETIKALGAESWAADKWERSVAETIRTSVKARLISSISLNVIVTAQMVSAVAIMFLGVGAIMEGEATAGALIAAVILNSRALAPLGQVAQVLTRLYQARLAYKALRGIVNAPQERPIGKRFVLKPKLEGEIAFKDLTFTYPDEKTPALSGVSFRLGKGERVALVGPIGSGKSTALRLILKIFDPDSGSILIDQLDVGNMDPAILRANVGYMPQDAQLFRGTIRTNITVHGPDADDADLVRAARQAGALDWINQRAAGFDNPVGERGEGLSGGQRQSVALSRAFLKDPPILLLDEPTSEMDALSERIFINQMKKESKGKTLIVVTHRPALLDLVDRVIVLEAGRVRLDGPKDKVMQALRSARRGTEAPEDMPATREESAQEGSFGDGSPVRAVVPPASEEPT